MDPATRDYILSTISPGDLHPPDVALLRGCFCVFVAAFNVSFLTDLASVFPKLFQQMTAYYAVNGTVFALELLALIAMSFSLQFYAALAAGHSFANHKMALSVAFFFVFQFWCRWRGPSFWSCWTRGRCSSC